MNQELEKHFPLGTILMCVTMGFGFLIFKEQHLIGSALGNNWLNLGFAQSDKIWSGEIHRFFSAMFLHQSFIHLGINVFILLQIGKIVEPMLKTGRLLQVFFLSGVSGFALSILMGPEPTLGASGAIMGIFGVLLAILLGIKRGEFERLMMWSAFLFLLLNLSLSYLLNNTLLVDAKIDVWSLVGGFSFGFLYGISLLSDLRNEGVLKQTYASPLVSNAFLLVALTSFSAVTMASISPFYLERYQVAMAKMDYYQGVDLGKSEYFRNLGSLSDKSRLSAQLLTLGAHLQRNEVQEAQLIAKTLFSEVTDQRAEEVFKEALAMLGKVRDENQAIFQDERAFGLICEGTLNQAAVDSTFIYQKCAWLFLMAQEKSIQNLQQALIWARKAVAKMDTKESGAALEILFRVYEKMGMQDAATAIQERVRAQSGVIAPDWAKLSS